MTQVYTTFSCAREQVLFLSEAYVRRTHHDWAFKGASGWLLVGSFYRGWLATIIIDSSSHSLSMPLKREEGWVRVMDLLDHYTEIGLAPWFSPTAALHTRVAMTFLGSRSSFFLRDPS
ncbi:unnamed protein product [Cyclocybe aegerita]|uniref:Uncharacterized protein n=1 Tax=Cyclocybe aegerita TaxID=1973307 RepID=A0A8S0WJV1_CYCAE|nr:unnamed protein product [Cyclocybe aegerita]